jgi:hypothetical protein
MKSPKEDVTQRLEQEPKMLLTFGNALIKTQSAG